MTSILPSTLLQQIYGNGFASRALEQSSTNPNAQSQTSGKSSDQYSDVIDISNEGLAAAAKQKKAEAVDRFLKLKGQDLYENALEGLKTYPEEFSLIADDRSLPLDVRTAASKAMVERELEAFAKYGRQSPPDVKKYYEEYIKYLDTLSPTERESSPRYAGQRAIVEVLYRDWSEKEGTEPEDYSRVRDPILILFEEIQAGGFKVDDAESFRARYERIIAPMLEGENGGELRAEADRALERFDALQDVLDAARDGDGAAFEWLKKLVGDAAVIEDFMFHAKGLRQPEETA